MEVNRRNFLVSGSAAVAGAVCAVEEANVHGGLAPITKPGRPERAHPVLPAGAVSEARFVRKCVGCQLCVTACPEHVLRPSCDVRHLGQPMMDFSEGRCKLDCNRCGSVCPTGAIRPLTVEQKRTTHIAQVTWHHDRCLVTAEGAACQACSLHCPVQAIYRVPLKANEPNGLRVPTVDARVCIGCGTCEHVCPARPMPAMTLDGLTEHRIVVPMSPIEAEAEAVTAVKEGRAACVIVTGGVITAHGQGRGISPLLDLYDGDPTVLCGVTVVDKIVGRAAAAICVAGGAKCVHALVMSEGAATFLKKHGIRVKAEKTVPQIMARDGKDICPLERAVAKQSEPEAMLKAVRRKREELRARK